MPVSGPTIKKVIAASKAIGCSIVSNPSNLPLSMQHNLPELSGLSKSLARQRGVYPSTIRKLLEVLPISETTRHKLDLSSEEGTPVCAPDHAGTNSTAALKNKLREIIKSDVDMFNLASKLGVTATSLRKIYEGKPVSSPLANKVAAALSAPNLIDLRNKPSAQLERLQTIYNLYKQLGTLEAVGKQIGVTRERVRQLLAQGDRIGLFEYNPREYPFVSKEKIIEDYKKTFTLSRVARLNNISTTYLCRLLTAYSITEQQLEDYPGILELLFKLRHTSAVLTISQEKLSMTRMVLSVTIGLLLTIGTVWASPLEDTTAANTRGDHAASLKAFQSLAAQGNAEAQNNLGELYAKGQGVPQDYAQARQWYEKAAAQGNALAQNNLAELYFAGLGVPQDYVRAYLWVSLAAVHMKGDEQKQAEENRNDVAGRMTPEQITEAKRLTQQCLALKFKGC